MVYEYQCANPECLAITERRQPLSDPRPESIPCTYCNASFAFFKISAPAVRTSGMSNTTLDVAIGQYSDRRWQDIHQRQEARNKVREQSGQRGLHATRFDQFEPISAEQKKVRTRVMAAVEKQGFRQNEDNTR